jgi:hypothetical protein
LYEQVIIFQNSAISNTTVRIIPQAKGKVNYKADALIQVVEEKLPNGAQGWVEVAALYQHHSGEGLRSAATSLRNRLVSQVIQRRI